MHTHANILNMIRPACIPIIPSYTRKQSSKQSSEQKYCYAHTSTPAAPAQGADHGSALVYSPAGGRWLRRSYIPPRVGPRRVASADPRGYSSSCIFLKIRLLGRSSAADRVATPDRVATQKRCTATASLPKYGATNVRQRRPFAPYRQLPVRAHVRVRVHVHVHDVCAYKKPRPTIRIRIRE